MRKILVVYLVTVLCVFTIGVSQAQYTEQINSNRPSQSMGAFSVGKNVYQLEQGILFRQGTFENLYNANFQGVGTRLQLRFGLVKEQLEVVGTIDYQLDALAYQNAVGDMKINRKGLRDLSAGVKYLVYDPFRNTEKYKVNLYSYHANNKVRWRDLIPAVAVYAGAQFGTEGVYPYQENFYPLYDFYYRPIEEPVVSVSGMLILQQHLKPGLVLVHNIGMRYITADIQQKKLIGTLTYSTRDKFSFFGEYQIDDSPLHRDITLGAGVAYLLTNNLQVDVALQQSVKTTPDLFSAGVGVSFRLDRHNPWKAEPQSLKEFKQKKKDRKKTFKEGKAARKSEKRTAKGLRKLDKKQKKIERKLKKLK